MKTLLKNLHSIGVFQKKRMLITLFSFAVLSAFAEVASIGALMPVVTLLFSPEDALNFLERYDIYLVQNMNIAQIQLLVVVFFAISIVSSILLRVYLVYLTNSFSFSFAAELSNRLLKLALSADYDFHVGGRSNELLSMLTKVQTIGNDVVVKLTTGVAAFVVSLIIIAFLCVVNLTITLVFIGSVVAGYFAVSSIYRARLQKYAQLLPISNDDRIKFLSESAEGIKDIIILDLVDSYSNSFSKANSSYFDALAQSIYLAAVPRYFIEGIALFAFGLICYVLQVSGATAAEILTLIGVFALGAQKLLPQAQMMYHCWASVKSSSGMAFDIFALNQELGKVQRLKFAKIPFRQTLTLRNVSFSHGQAEKSALVGVSLAINKGELVAIVGPSGSGKSTLIDILMFLHSPKSGEVLVDDKVLTHDEGSGWWQNITHVSQKAFVHSGSILENICLSNQTGADCSPELDKILSICELKDVIDKKPQGIETPLGENGSLISGGQRQRVAIARALYNRRSVIVLDEATSAMDEALERRILASIRREFPELTIIIVTHRISSLPCCDKIIEVENGNIRVRSFDLQYEKVDVE